MQTSEEDIHTKKINFCVVGELIFFSPLRDINKELTAIEPMMNTQHN